MYPILFELGPVTVYSYGLMLAVAFLAAVLGAKKMAPTIGIQPERMTDLALFAILGGLAVAYVNYVISYDWSSFSADPLGVLRFWEGGLVFLGGLVGGIIFALAYIYKFKLPVWEIADVAAIFVPLAYGIGRIGCFLAGCCYGVATDVAWAVTFPGVWGPRHPTQLYSSALGLALFAFALLVRKRRTFAGQGFLLYLIIYGVGRSLIEMLRVNPHAFNSPLTVAQFTGLGLALTATVLYPILRRRNKYSG